MKEKMNNGAAVPAPDPKLERRRRICEGLATVGLLLVCVSLVVPVFAFDSPWANIFKWVCAAGALVYTAARIVGAVGHDASFRVRRLRRLEVWAGIAFCFASFFWFYNTRAFDGRLLTFRMLSETILFTLVGALIQIVASWMLSSALRKESR